MIRLRPGSGLGDSIQAVPVVAHLLKYGLEFEVATNYPEVFDHLAVDTIPFTKANVDILAHYINGKGKRGTSQFQDICETASKSLIIREKGISLENIVYSMERPIKRTIPEIIGREIKTKKKIAIIGLPRLPFGGANTSGKEMLPDFSIVQGLIDRLFEEFFFIQVGTGDRLYDYSGIDLDLADKTSINDLLDVASVADLIVSAGSSFLIPLAEVLNKINFTVWAAAGMRSSNPFIRTITPEKILHPGKRGGFIVDDWSEERRIKALLDFLGAHYEWNRC